MGVETKRLQYVDVVKGIAIVMVVFYHLLAPCLGKTIINHLMDPFLVSFFFFSGFFYKPGKRSVGESIKNRAKSLMVPFFRYSLFFWLVGTIYLVATESETIKEAFLCLRNFLCGCIWNRVIQDWFGWEYYSLGKRYFFLADFWFLLSMLFASILFFLIADWALCSRAKALLTVLLLFVVTGICQNFSVSLPYNIQLVPYWTAFMLLGAFAGQQKLFELPSLSNAARWGAGAALLITGIVVCMVKEPSPNQFRGSFGENEVVSMLCCIAAGILVIWGLGLLCRMAEQSGARVKEVAWLGSHSLIIYLYHMFFAWIICIITGFSIRYEEPTDAGTIAKSVLLTAACLGLTIIRNMIEDRLKKHQ